MALYQYMDIPFIRQTDGVPKPEEESSSKTHAYQQIRAIRFAPPHINKERCDNWASEQSSADLQ